MPIKKLITYTTYDRTIKDTINKIFKQKAGKKSMCMHSIIRFWKGNQVECKTRRKYFLFNCTSF